MTVFPTPRVIGVNVISWSTSCPHCISIRVCLERVDEYIRSTLSWLVSISTSYTLNSFYVTQARLDDQMFMTRPCISYGRGELYLGSAFASSLWTTLDTTLGLGSMLPVLPPRTLGAAKPSSYSGRKCRFSVMVCLPNSGLRRLLQRPLSDR